MSRSNLKKNAYDLILSKQVELSSIITKCATENRAPSPEELTQLQTLKADIEATRAEWESTGRNAFLASLAAPGVTKSNNGQLVLKAADSFGKHLEGTYPDEFKGLSLGKLLRGYVTGDWADAAPEQKAMGSSPLSSGGMLIPTPLAADVIDLARNQTRVLQAGAITVPMATATLKYARLSQDATAAWTAESTNIALSAAAFDSVTFTAHKLAALVAIDNELLEDAANADATIHALHRKGARA
jgi:HK97 family phage major capsid protein